MDFERCPHHHSGRTPATRISNIELISPPHGPGKWWAYIEPDDRRLLLIAPGVVGRMDEQPHARATWRCGTLVDDGEELLAEGLQTLDTAAVLVLLAPSLHEEVLRISHSRVQQLKRYAGAAGVHPDERRARDGAVLLAALVAEVQRAFPYEDWGVDVGDPEQPIEVPETLEALLSEMDTAGFRNSAR